ncbi:sulfite exporter TauE/SafE family protein [Flavobacterium sp. NRK F10]|uniref:sulfite exporter TauE/SafE family protein n=1 Tax=Flavobacterium sp. NRK F10 TaxID=2954931 RepID=UPI0020911581|nr:sulfite exporter TauE/SafE family protein [Flavobacterium sp. NRK F10]MCO6176088.1 sulfite exporter TauE/SafE family protein [Flavobacterium sp. NRK F10]
MLYTAVIFGLISSLHCVGMCGPIAMMLPVDRSNQATKTIQILLYHLGRITAYSSLGLLFGILGRGFYLAGMQQQLSIVVGVIMIVIAVVPEKQFAKYNFSKPVYKIISRVKSSLGNQFKKKTMGSIYTIGVLNGFLPCGMVYVALFGALAMNRLDLSVLYMVLYGIGTIPMMSLVVYVSNLLTVSFRSKLQKAIPVIAVCIGILFIMRGLGLSIPYISPGDVSLFVQSEANCH